MKDGETFSGETLKMVCGKGVSVDDVWLDKDMTFIYIPWFNIFYSSRSLNASFLSLFSL